MSVLDSFISVLLEDSNPEDFVLCSDNARMQRSHTKSDDFFGSTMGEARRTGNASDRRPQHCSSSTTATSPPTRKGENTRPAPKRESRWKDADGCKVQELATPKRCRSPMRSMRPLRSLPPTDRVHPFSSLKHYEKSQTSLHALLDEALSLCVTEQQHRPIISKQAAVIDPPPPSVLHPPNTLASCP